MISDQQDESIDAEDSSSQAGWLYTDLLLALMVIFLATISFVPAEVSPSKMDNKDATTSKEFINPLKSSDNSFTVLLKKESDIDIANKVQAFLMEKFSKTNKQVTVLQVVGGFDPKSESEADGMLTALSFASKLRAKNPELFASARSTISSSALIQKGQAVVRLTFE